MSWSAGGLLKLLACLLLLAENARAAAEAKGNWLGWYFDDYSAKDVGPTTLTTQDDYKTVENLWCHNTRWYAVMDRKDFDLYNSTFTDIVFSQNMGISKLPVSDVSAYLGNLHAAWVNGTTLWLDYSFPAFPENIGHWLEMLLPVYSQLSIGAWKEHVPPGEEPVISACILPNLRRGQVQSVPWVVDLLKLALTPGLAPGTDLPTVLFYDEMESLNRTTWMGFERVLYIQDRYTHPAGRSGAATPELGARFRDDAYKMVNFGRHNTWDQHIPPHTMTYIMSMNGDQVVNNAEMLASLRDLGSALGMKVRPYTVTTSAHFTSYVATMAKTGVLVTRHGPLLGNAVFLPPGALVLELLPYNWEWKGISGIYLNLTRSIGDIHHFAWRAMSSQWVVYAEPEDSKYAHWTLQECSSKHCLEAHARAGMLADISTVHEILAELLPDVLRGESVESLRPKRPWPKVELGDGHTGLWWDVQ